MARSLSSFSENVWRPNGSGRTEHCGSGHRQRTHMGSTWLQSRHQVAPTTACLVLSTRLGGDRLEQLLEQAGVAHSAARLSSFLPTTPPN